MFKIYIIWTVFFLLTFSSLTSCTRAENSDSFTFIDFGYFNNSPEAFNLRITGNDTIFLFQQFSSDTTSRFQDSVLYYGLLQRENKTTLDSIVSVINYQTLNPVYDSDDLDGEVYSFYFAGDTAQKLIQVRNGNSPSQLKRLKEFLLQLKKETQFREARHSLSFNVPAIEIPPLDTTGSR